MASNPSNFRLYRYNPSIGASVVFIILFIIASGFHTYKAARTRTWFLIPFVVGGYFEWIGYIGRAISATEAPAFTLSPYILQTLLLLIAPTLFAASIYMELGRIILLTNGDAYCLLPRRWLTKIFLLGDIVSFVMQGAGGGIMASGTADALTTGENIIIAGLVIQLLFFSLFVYTSLSFHLRLRRRSGSSWKLLDTNQPRRWQRHMYALYTGSGLILIRSLFRLVEYAQGNAGYLVSHEAYLYLFDAVLMVLVMVVFACVYPGELEVLAV
ncbi:putative RTM1-like protein [Aspergillus desertorum]